MKRVRTLATVVFVGLAIVLTVLAVMAKRLFTGDALAQQPLLVLGASFFGSGLTFPD